MINISWFNDSQTIILWQMPDYWTLDDFHQAVDQTEMMLRSVDYHVHVIVDAHDVYGVPPHFLSAVIRRSAFPAPNYEGAVFVGANSFIRMLLNTLANLPSSRGLYRFARSVNEAEGYILEAKVIHPTVSV